MKQVFRSRVFWCALSVVAFISAIPVSYAPAETLIDSELSCVMKASGRISSRTFPLSVTYNPYNGDCDVFEDYFLPEEGFSLPRFDGQNLSKAGCKKIQKNFETVGYHTDRFSYDSSMKNCGFSIYWPREK